MNLKEIYAFFYKIRYPLLLVLLLLVIEVLDSFSGSYLHYWGNYPREIFGIPGIVTSHFIHSTWGHLASNFLPMLLLTSVLVLFYPKVAGQAFVSILLGTGIMVWLFARPSYHIGASGMVYGLVSFIFWLGVFKKNAKSIVLSLIVLMLYFGSAEGLFPGEERVSWESHLFGAMVGWVVAFVFRSVVEDDELAYKRRPSWADDINEKSFFLPRDIFEKTKQQRHQEQLEQQRLDQEERERMLYNYIYKPRESQDSKNN